jgi:hypothetical protein
MVVVVLVAGPVMEASQGGTLVAASSEAAMEGTQVAVSLEEWMGLVERGAATVQVREGLAGRDKQVCSGYLLRILDNRRST